MKIFIHSVLIFVVITFNIFIDFGCQNTSADIPITLPAEKNKSDTDSSFKYAKTINVSAFNAPEAIKAAGEDTLVILNTIPSSENIQNIREALFVLHEKNEKIVIGLDFSGSVEKEQSRRTAINSEKEKFVIPEDAFYDMDRMEGVPNLRNVIMPEGLINIGRRAFKGCFSLIEVIIPSTVINIGANVFDECKSLKEVDIPAGVETIETSSFKGCTSLLKVSIPESVTKIDDDAFFNCDRLEKIQLPSKLTYIGNFAFTGCQTIKSISIPKGVTHIGEKAFKGTSISTVRIYANKYEIGNEVFSECGTFDLIIAANEDNAFDCSFENCTGLKSIEIQNGVTGLHSNFNGCKNLKSIEIPSSVKSVSCYFRDTENLEELLLPEGVEEMYFPWRMFSGSKLRKLILPQSLSRSSTIWDTGNSGWEMLSGCNYLEYVDLGGLPRIPHECIGNSQFLKNVIVSNKLKEIESRAFNQSKFQKFTIPASVEIISGLDDGAFGYSGIIEIEFEDKNNWFLRTGNSESNYTYSPVEISDNPHENAIKFGTKFLRTSDGWIDFNADYSIFENYGIWKGKGDLVHNPKFR